MALREGRAYFLSDAFFDAYPSERFPEIEAKRNRPYVFYVIKLRDGVWFAIPLRSNVKHPFVFRTSETGGLDYSKAIPILDEAHVDSTRRAYVRSSELPIIRKNRGAIKDGLRAYIEQYQEARKHPQRARNARLIRYSTLQYFEDTLEMIDGERAAGQARCIETDLGESMHMRSCQRATSKLERVQR